MTELRGRSKLAMKVSDNLQYHRYSEWIERPGFDYVGPTNIDDRGNITTRAPSKRTMTFHLNVMVWTRDHQGDAVMNGFFLHRSGVRNRVNVIAVDWIGGFDSSDGYAAIDWLEHQLFSLQNEPKQARIFKLAFDFIHQQDRFGYPGAWDRSVQFHSNRLDWYRAWRAGFHPTLPQSKRVLDTHQKKVDGATVAQNWAYGHHLRKNWLDVNGVPKPPDKTIAAQADKLARGRPRSPWGTQMSKKWPGQDPTVDPTPVEKIKRTRSRVTIKSIFGSNPKGRRPVITDPNDMIAGSEFVIDPGKIGVKS